MFAPKERAYMENRGNKCLTPGCKSLARIKGYCGYCYHRMKLGKLEHDKGAQNDPPKNPHGFRNWMWVCSCGATGRIGMSRSRAERCGRGHNIHVHGIDRKAVVVRISKEEKKKKEEDQSNSAPSL